MTTDVPDPTDPLAADALGLAPQPELPADCRYQLLRFLAEGGLGQVFVGFDRELGREVAVKFVRPTMVGPSAIARFQREAEITGRLEHPGVVPVYGLLALPTGGFCYAMRLLAGQTLAAGNDYHDLPPEKRPAALRKLLRHFVDVCDTVAFAHSRGVLHRDIKPANVMLGDFGETWLLDWGLGKETRNSEFGIRNEDKQPADPASDFHSEFRIPNSELTTVGSTVGTPGYMSPEQARDAGTVGPSTDVYALGATLGVILTGNRPTQLGWLDDSPPETPAALLAVVRKAMAPIADTRYPSATALAKDVEAFLADEPVSAYRDPPRERLRRWAKRHRTAVVGLVGLFVAAVPLAVILVLVSDRGRRQAETDAGRIAAEKATADDQRAEAVRQKTDADRSAADARAAVDKYLLTVSRNDTLTEPRLKPLRRELLAAALDFYTRLADEQRQRPGDREELVRTLERLTVLHSDLGSFTAGIATAEQGRALAVEIDPVRFAATITDFDYMLVALYGGVNRPADADAALKRASAAANTTDSTDAQRAVFDAMSALNIRPKDAAAFRKLADAVAKLDAIVRQSPADPKSRNQLAYGQFALGMRAADLTESERLLQTALGHARRLINDHPTNAQYSDAYQQCLSALGMTYRRQRQFDSAVRCLTEAVEHYEKRVTHDPNDIALRLNLVRSLYQLGGTYFDAGKEDAAGEVLPRVERVTDQLLRDDPLNGAYSTAAVQVCVDQVRIGRYADALGGYERLANLLAAEVVKPSPAAGAKGVFVTALFGAAECQLFLNRPTDAATTLDRLEPLLVFGNRARALVLRRVAAAQTGRHAAVVGSDELATDDRRVQRMAAWGYVTAFAAAATDPTLSPAERKAAQTQYADAAVALLRKSLTGPMVRGPAGTVHRLPAFAAVPAVRPVLADLEAAIRHGEWPVREVAPVPRAVVRPVK